MAQAVAKAQVIEQCGPYGSQLQENFSWQVKEGERIMELLVWHGEVINAFGVVVLTPNGSTYTKTAGSLVGNESKVKLAVGEYFNGISGKYGNYNDQNFDGVVVGQLTLYTNLNPNGYGPFGEFGFQTFNSAKGVVVDIFGRANKYLESIGVFEKMEFPSSN